jgi:hypothetical protein
MRICFPWPMNLHWMCNMAGTRVFISYRRDDSAGHAGRLYDRLAQQFGEAQVFLDFEAIPGASDFTEEIRNALSHANFVLALIGPGWLRVTDPGGKPRLQNPNDLVRQEIRIALDSGTSVVPVLVGGAKMPRKEHLPPDISRLHTINAVTISDRRFSADADDLIRAIARIGETSVTVTPSAEVRPGHWEISKTHFGADTVTIVVELRRDGTLQGRLGDVGGHSGQMLEGLFGGAGDFSRAIAQLVSDVQYFGQWSYNASSKLLTLNIMGQVQGLGGGAETWQIWITGSNQGVYQGRDQLLTQYTLKRIA